MNSTHRDPDPPDPPVPAEANPAQLGPSRRTLVKGAAVAAAASALGCQSEAPPTETTTMTTSKPTASSDQQTLARVTVRRSSERGHADHGWLDTYHTFSFAEYYDPEHMTFGPLRVLNQDRVAAGRGFGTHPHRDMEIVSFVLDGVMAHKDSMGNGSEMRPGEVQLMSAGTGVQHSEFNASKDEGLHFLQMWVMPAEGGTKPRYEQKAYSREERQGQLRLVVSPDGADGSLTIGQDARLYTGLFAPGEEASGTLEAGRGAWLHVATGSVEVNGVTLAAGDGAALEGGDRYDVRGLDDAEVVLWDVAVS